MQDGGCHKDYTYDAVLALDDGTIVQCPRFFLRLDKMEEIKDELNKYT